MFRYDAPFTVASSKKNGPITESDVRAQHTFNFGSIAFMFHDLVWVLAPPNSAVVPVHLTRHMEGGLIREDNVFHKCIVIV
jgi:hypothetical protein